MNISPLTKRIALVNFSVNFSVIFFEFFFPAVLCDTCLEKKIHKKSTEKFTAAIRRANQKNLRKFLSTKKSEKFTLGLLLCESLRLLWAIGMQIMKQHELNARRNRSYCNAEPIGTKPEPSLNQNHANEDRSRPRGFRNTRACTVLSRTGAEPRLNQS